MCHCKESMLKIRYRIAVSISILYTFVFLFVFFNQLLCLIDWSFRSGQVTYPRHSTCPWWGREGPLLLLQRGVQTTHDAVCPKVCTSPRGETITLHLLCVCFVLLDNVVYLLFRLKLHLCLRIPPRLLHLFASSDWLLDPIFLCP